MGQAETLKCRRCRVEEPMAMRHLFAEEDWTLCNYCDRETDEDHQALLSTIRVRRGGHGGSIGAWNKPKTIYALPLGHPNRRVTSAYQANKVMEAEGLVCDPADQSGVRHERTTFSSDRRNRPKLNSQPAAEVHKRMTRHMRRR